MHLLSSIGKKLIISLSGAFLLIFLALHLVLNLSAVYSEEAYDAVCKFMDGPFIKPMVPVLALGFIVHILLATYFELKNWTARPREMRYAVATKTKCSWSAKNMFVLGIIVLGFLGMHMCHFWAKLQLQHFLGNEPEQTAYQLALELFSNPVYCLLYAVWILAIAAHVNHGFWSAFQSLGLNNSKWLPRLQFLSKIYAIVVAVGYLIIPVCFWLKTAGSACCAC